MVGRTASGSGGLEAGEKGEAKHDTGQHHASEMQGTYPAGQHLHHDVVLGTKEIGKWESECSSVSPSTAQHPTALRSGRGDVSL